MFRNTISLSSTYSTRINFTAADFFHHSQKISILNWIKCDQSSQEDDNEVLSFPIHHKHAGDSHLSPVQTFDDIEQLDIEKTILDAFNQALKLTQPLEISKLLKEHDIFELNSLSKYVFQELNSSSRMFDYLVQTIDDDTNEFNLKEEEDNENENTANNLSDDEETMDDIELEEDENNYSMTTINTFQWYKNLRQYGTLSTRFLF
ncbi:unnamed protein product [Rotaria sordida]|uniref:Uncharacterized protein n=1 Tax=Rotaria sordida TaxID=392033 RepID=A0A814Y1H4_9BILA|nr:unnamed protein product [Rotaria sordida]CAF1503788.1 unnamed protein product [Rotaria sordida]